MVELTVAVEVATGQEQTWRAATDWPRQGDWIPLTTVRVTHGDGHRIGDRVVARTALGPVGFDDPMEITGWQPPHRCDVVHHGRVVRGTGIFTVEPSTTGGSRFVWTECLDLPFGRAGQVAFGLVRPLAVLSLRAALRRFARFAASAPPPISP
jgi:hypothetical protein